MIKLERAGSRECDVLIEGAGEFGMPAAADRDVAGASDIAVGNECTAVRCQRAGIEHAIDDLQRAAVSGFEQAGIDDRVASIEDESAISKIGVNRAGGLIDQREIAIADADLAGAGD